MKKDTGIKTLFILSIALGIALGFTCARAVMSARIAENTAPEPAPTEVQAPVATIAATEPPEPAPATPTETPTPTQTPSPTPEPVVEYNISDGVLVDLQAELEGYFSTVGLAPTSKWNVYVTELETGASAFAKDSNEGESPTIAASLIKLFIAGAVFQEARYGTENADTLKSGSETLTNLEAMLRDSENEAANALITGLGEGGDFDSGMVKVNAFAKSIGCTDTKINRRLAPEEEVEGENYTTVQDCAKALSMIAHGTFVSKEASERILAWLALEPVWNTNKNSKIRAGIDDPGAVVANKTGENTTPFIIENDVAIVMTEKAQYVLCIMSNPTNSPGAKEMIQEISALVHGFFNG